MSVLPATGYFTNGSRTNGEAKQAQDDILSVIRELLGGQGESELTIAAGSVTPDRGVHSIDTESDASTDDLANISQTNHPDGRMLLIHVQDQSREVTVKHQAGGAGQIKLIGGADLVLDDTYKWLMLKRTGTLWEEIGFFPLNHSDRHKSGGSDALPVDSVSPSMLIQLRAKAQSTPDMTVAVGAGNYKVDESAIVEYAGGNTPTVTAPTTDPRIDVLEIDGSGTLTWNVGTEAASPVANAYSTDKISICEIYVRVGATSIKDTDDSTNGYIKTDARPFLNLGSSTPAAKYRTFTKEAYIEDPTASDVFSILRVPYAVTVKEITGETDTGTVDFNVEERTSPDVSGTDTMASDLQAAATEASQTSFSNDAIAANARLVIVASAIAGSPTKLWVTVKYEID